MRVTLPIPPSVNHCYLNAHIKTPKGVRIKRVLTAEAKTWMEEATLRVTLARRKARWETRPKGVKVVVWLTAHWPDARRRDMSNLHKLVADALEDAEVYADDSWALLRDKDFDVDRQHPRLEVECEEL